MSRSKSNLYIGCALTYAPDNFKQDVEQLKDNLRTDYDVLDFVGLKSGTAVEVYESDLDCVRQCDYMLAITDYPSLGLGWELATATSLNKPTLAVAQVNNEVSRLVLGAAEVHACLDFEQYEDMQDIPDLLGDFILQTTELATFKQENVENIA